MECLKKDFNTQYSGRYLLGLPLELTWSKDDGTMVSLRSGVSLTPANNMASFFLGFQTFLSIPLDEDKEKATVGKFLIGTGLDLFVGGTEKQLTIPSAISYRESETFKVKTTILQFPAHFLLGASVTFKEQLELYCLFGPYISFESIFIQVRAYSEAFSVISLGFTMPQVGLRVWF